MKKKRPITDAVEIMHRRYINTFRRKLLYYCWHKPQFWIENKLDTWAYKRATKKGWFKDKSF